MDIPTHEIMYKKQQEADILKNSLNDLLRNREYDRIKELFCENPIRELSGYCQEIYIMYILTKIYDLEQNNSILSFDNKNVEQLVRMYRIVSLYLRRLEFDFPMEYQKEIIGFIKTYNLSADYLYGVIMYNKAIKAKQKVLSQLKDLLTKEY